LEGTQVLVIAAVEEEARSRGAHHLVGKLTPPDAVIIGEPSSWEGITLGYKGTLAVEYHLTKEAGHGAGDRLTPAEEAIAFWNCLSRYAAERNGPRRPPRFDTLDATLRSINTSGNGLEDQVRMSIGLRLPIGLDVPVFQRVIGKWCGCAEVTFPYREQPFQADKNTPVVRALLRAIRAEGGQPRFKLKTGTSDMNVVGPVWDCPIAAYGPGDSSLDHTPHERIELAEFRRAVSILARVLMAL
jgi:LysW-gamma-L-lysine carboxypeptidase